MLRCGLAFLWAGLAAVLRRRPFPKARADLPWRFGRDFAANFLMSQLLLFSAERRVPAYRAVGSETAKAARICC